MANQDCAAASEQQYLAEATIQESSSLSGCQIFSSISSLMGFWYRHWRISIKRW
ncbi:MAG: hypothetical protein NZ730_09615 [Porticoccaceae bacterium]|nr:hypothetical protein [Porticoccaceae bacterium]